MKVPFLDLRAAYLEVQDEIDDAVARVLSSGWYILGPETEAFEQDYAAFCGAGECIGVANGLDALILSLRALDVGPGDEVIVPANTFIATWLAVSAVGAKIVPVEPDKQTYNLDSDAVEAAITKRTKAIIAVHLYGQPADLDPLLNLARNNGLFLIEDAAQAHGAAYKGRRIGAHGDAVCWSFYPGKNLGAMGDAGAVTTNSTDLAARLKMLRNYGSAQKYVNEEPGVNSRLDPLQAAILGVKLKHLDAWTLRRQAIAKRYIQELSDVVVPHVPNWAEPVWHLFVIRHPSRDALQAKLEEAGIATMVHYPIPPHMQQAYAEGEWAQGQFPISEQTAADMLTLPCGPHMSDAEVDYVITTVNKLAAG